MTWCCVVGCSNRGGHRFPKNEVLRKKWIKALGWEEQRKITPASRVCNSHFRDCDFAKEGFESGLELTKKYLHKTAVPSVFPDPDRAALLKYRRKNQIYRNVTTTASCPGIEKSNEKKKMYIVSEINPEFEDFENVVEIKEESMEEPELETISELFPERPLGDEILRVCRTCLRIMKIEDTVPLLHKTELYNRFASLLQIDLLTVKNCCLCKDCEGFINAVHTFRATCKVNEGALREFDWENKTKDLLHVVDQDELRTVYNEIKGIPCSSTATAENKPFPSTEDVCVENNLDQLWKELDEKGNGLSDLEDHWYGDDKQKEKDHDNPDKSSSYDPASNCLSIGQDDIFSPAFDKYFEMLGDGASLPVKMDCRKNYSKTEGKGPFLCQYCGKMIGCRMSFTRHMKLHNSADRFRCEECDEDLVEWPLYTAHCKSVHNGFPKSFKCHLCSKMYRFKKMLDLHMSIHDVENSMYPCADCKMVFKKKTSLEKHRTLHRNSEVLCKYCGLRVRKSALNRHIQSKHVKGKCEGFKRTFKCDFCEKCYLREGSLGLHMKQCHSEENFLPSLSTENESVVDGVEYSEVLENYEIVMDETCGSAEIVVLENGPQFSNINRANLVLMQED